MVIIRPFLCVLFPLWFSIFFWCNNFAFSEVGGVSHLYLYSPMFNYVLSTAAQGNNPHFRFTLPSQFPFFPAFLCALLLLQLPQIPVRATALCDSAIHVD